jgi:hypothetical protein
MAFATATTTTYVVVNSRGETTTKQFIPPHLRLSQFSNPLTFEDPPVFTTTDLFASIEEVGSYTARLEDIVSASDFQPPQAYSILPSLPISHMDDIHEYPVTPSSSEEESVNNAMEGEETEEEEEEASGTVEAPAAKPKKSRSKGLRRVGRPKIILSEQEREAKKDQRREANNIAVKKCRANDKVKYFEMQNSLQRTEFDLNKANSEIEKLRAEVAKLQAELKNSKKK